MRDPVLVGITTAELFTPAQAVAAAESEPPQRRLAIGMDYPEAVVAAGGVPVVLPPMVEVDDAVLSRLDALLVSGGPDVDPALYGAEPHPHLGPVEREADPYELDVLRRADAQRMPILAVCRGMQLVNVARGGTLWQDLPSQRPSELVHRQTAPSSRTTHAVAVDRDSSLARAMGILDGPGSDDVRTNSFHHQAVRDLGRGLRVVARAPDGTVEGIEATDHPFLLGVQWHAESLLEDPRQLRLFSALVDAARTPRTA